MGAAAAVRAGRISLCSVFQRVRELYAQLYTAAAHGAPLLQPGGNVLYAFPTAQALAAAGEQALRDCALGYRAPYVLAAAQAVAAGTLDLAALETLPDARLLEALMQQHGVGIKVANCVALFAYGRMECAPVDVWIQRVIDQHYAGQNPFPAYGNAGILQQWMFYFARSEKERVKEKE